MKRIDFTQQGGFPLQQRTLEFMQKATQEIIDAFIDFHGGKSHSNHPAANVIVSGLIPETTLEGTVDEPYLRAGWVLMNGQLLYFPGALLSEVENAGGIGVVSNETDAVFQDGNVMPVYLENHAAAGGEMPVPLDGFIRLDKRNFYRDIIKITTGQFVNSIPAGGNTTFVIENSAINKGDMVLVELHGADQSSRLVFINTRVVEDGKAIVTLINLESMDQVFGDEQIFDVRIIK